MNVHPLDEDSKQPVALSHRINSSLSLVYTELNMVYQFSSTAPMLTQYNENHLLIIKSTSTYWFPVLCNIEPQKIRIYDKLMNEQNRTWVT